MIAGIVSPSIFGILQMLAGNQHRRKTDLILPSITNMQEHGFDTSRLQFRGIVNGSPYSMGSLPGKLTNMEERAL
jgi:hypothetical protein